jgi:hypothetical protein
MTEGREGGPSDRYIAPNCIERVKVFQLVFVKYFPWFEDIYAAAPDWSWLHSRWVLNPIETVRRKQAEADLERVVRALRLIATCEMPWSMGLVEAQVAAKEAGAADQVVSDLGVVAEAVLDLQSMGEDGALEAVLAQFRKTAKRYLDHLPDTGSTKWRAVFAVDALRSVWWRNTSCEFAELKLKLEQQPERKVYTSSRWQKWRHRPHHANVEGCLPRRAGGNVIR